MIATKVQAQGNNANGYLVGCFKWYLDSSISSRIHKWYLDQLISDILQVVLMKIANVQEMVLLINQSYKWYHISTHDINHTRWWFHKWSLTLSDHQMKNASLTNKSSSLSSGWPMLWHRGRCHTNWYQGQRSYVWYLKSYTNGVIPTI
jgi:hypothetical protein